MIFVFDFKGKTERARGCETGISLEYLKLLYAGYDEFLKDIAKGLVEGKGKEDGFVSNGKKNL